MPITISWEPGKKMKSAKLVFEKNDRVIEEVDKLLIFATHGGCPVVFIHNINKEEQSIFIMKKIKFDWPTTCLAIERTVTQNIPDVVFKNTKNMT